MKALRHLLRFLVKVLPYAAIGVGLAFVVDWDGDDWLDVMGILVALRLAFALLDALASWITWICWDRHALVAQMTQFLRDHRFPPPAEAKPDYERYLSAVGGARESSAELKAAARAAQAAYAQVALLGWMARLRARAAGRAALRSMAR